MFDITPPTLMNFGKKPKILYIADVFNWSFHLKGLQYIKYLPQYDIDIGFAKTNSPEFYWENMCANKHYDVIWHLHSGNLPYKENFFKYIKSFNDKGTRVILTQNEVNSVESIKNDIKRLSAFNAISVNNPLAYKNFCLAGFNNIYQTYDGVDLNTFGPDINIENRKFKVLFISSKIRLEHKGYYIWERVKERLSDYNNIEFVEVITDSFNNKRSFDDMNLIYNDCQVYVCLSVSEGGPCTLLESAACGVVPIMTKVGYYEYFKNAITIERNENDCVNAILELRSNKKKLYEMSKSLCKEVLPWSDKLMSQHWGYFLQNSILYKRGMLI